MNKPYIVGIADMKMCRMQGELITYALGSCIGICLYDNVIKLAVMIHIMLPNCPPNSPAGSSVYKFADTGISAAVRKMTAMGAMKSRIKAKIAGGAKMFDVLGNADWANIGDRNAKAVKDALRQEGIPILAEDIGLNYARTMRFDAATGVCTVSAYGKPVRNL